MRWLMEGKDGRHPSRRWIPPARRRRTVSLNWFYTFSAHVKGSDWSNVGTLHLPRGERVASHFCDLHIVLINTFLWGNLCKSLQRCVTFTSYSLTVWPKPSFIKKKTLQTVALSKYFSVGEFYVQQEQKIGTDSLYKTVKKIWCFRSVGPLENNKASIFK